MKCDLIKSDYKEVRMYCNTNTVCILVQGLYFVVLYCIRQMDFVMMFSKKIVISYSMKKYCNKPNKIDWILGEYVGLVNTRFQI